MMMCVWHREGTQTILGREQWGRLPGGGDSWTPMKLLPWEIWGFVGHSDQRQWLGSSAAPRCVQRGYWSRRWPWTGRQEMRLQEGILDQFLPLKMTLCYIRRLLRSSLIFLKKFTLLLQGSKNLTLPFTHLRFIGWGPVNYTDRKQINESKTSTSLLPRTWPRHLWWVTQGNVWNLVATFLIYWGKGGREGTSGKANDVGKINNALRLAGRQEGVSLDVVLTSPLQEE